MIVTEAVEMTHNLNVRMIRTIKNLVISYVKCDISDIHLEQVKGNHMQISILLHC